jgi:hypothetical protein
MMVIENEFNIGDTVYLKTDKDQAKRIVTGINIRPGGTLIYVLTFETRESDHYDFEISETVDVLQTTTN